MTIHRRRGTIVVMVRLHMPDFFVRLNPRVDHMDLWFTRFQELAGLADLPEKHWATKVTEFLDADSIKTVFSLSEDQRKSYDSVKNETNL